MDKVSRELYYGNSNTAVQRIDFLSWVENYGTMPAYKVEV